MASGNSLTYKPVTEEGTRKMVPVQRARHLAYEPPSKDVQTNILLTQKRVQENIHSLPGPSCKRQDPEQEKQAKVVGQLKAAEARSRIRLMRFRFQCVRAQECKRLISCQPTVRDAIRLEVFLPIRPDMQRHRDPLDSYQRQRVEDLLQDDLELLTSRIP